MLPFYLGVYSYSAGLGQPAFTGLDMRFQYSAFSRLRYLIAGVYSYSAGLGQPAFTGLDMRFQYSAFSRLRYLLPTWCIQLRNSS